MPSWGNGSSWYIAFTLSVWTRRGLLWSGRASGPASPGKSPEVWRWLPALYCAHSVNTRLAPALSRAISENGKILSFSTSQQHGEYFSPEHPDQTECEVEPGFSKSDNFPPHTSLRFPVSPVEALLVGRNYSGPTVGQRAADIKVRKTDSKTELTRPGLTGSSEKQF